MKIVQRIFSFLLLLLLLPNSKYFQISAKAAENDAISSFQTELDILLDDSEEYYSVIEVKSIENDHEVVEEKTSTNRLIVKTNSNAFLSSNYGAIGRVEGFNCWHVFQYQSYEAASAALNIFNSLDFVAYAEFDELIPAEEEEVSNRLTTPVAPLSWGAECVGSFQVNQVLSSSDVDLQPVVVAVIDTGVDSTHSFFRNEYGDSRILPGNRMNDNIASQNHGTHVAGIIVDNTLPNVKIKSYNYDYYAGSKNECGTTITLATEIKSAINDGVDVINMSLGGYWLLQRLFQPYHLNALTDAISDANTQEIVVVVAAGNESIDAHFVSPANNPNVITVSSITKSLLPATYSNYGSCVDVAAPGSEIYSTLPSDANSNSNFGEMNGTSMAAPFVSAAAATLKALYPSMSPEAIKTRICSTAQKPRLWNSLYGSGILNFEGFLSDLLTAAPKITLTETAAVIAADPDATIYYSTDGNDPTLDSAVYTGPINTSNVRIVKAIACKSGYLPSAVASYRLKWDEDITVRYKGTKKVDFPTGYSVKRIYSGNDEIATLSADGKVIGNKVGDTVVHVAFQKNCMVTYHIHVEYAWWQQLIMVFLFGFLWY